MSDRRFALLSLLAATALIAGMVWHDLHPSAPEAESGAISGYYAAANATPVSIPDDNLPVTIAQGSFAGGVYTPAGVEPFTLVQRQINMLFRLDAAALRTPAPVLAQMEKVIGNWGKKGAQISALLIDASTSDLDAYAAFIEALRKHFTQDPHVVIPVAPAAGWPDSAGLRAVVKAAPLFAYHLDKPIIPDGFMEQRHKDARSFVLILPAGAEKAGLDDEALRKGHLYRGGYVTIDPANPPVLRKEHRIGLWPKISD